MWRPLENTTKSKVSNNLIKQDFSGHVTLNYIQSQSLTEFYSRATKIGKFKISFLLNYIHIE